VRPLSKPLLLEIEYTFKLNIGAADLLDQIENPFKIGAAAPLLEIQYHMNIAVAALSGVIKNPFKMGAAAPLL
jgi:hypothetical protein